MSKKFMYNVNDNRTVEEFISSYMDDENRLSSLNALELKDADIELLKSHNQDKMFLADVRNQLDSVKASSILEMKFNDDNTASMQVASLYENSEEYVSDLLTLSNNRDKNFERLLESTRNNTFNSIAFENQGELEWQVDNVLKAGKIKELCEQFGESHKEITIGEIAQTLEFVEAVKEKHHIEELADYLFKENPNLAESTLVLDAVSCRLDAERETSRLAELGVDIFKGNKEWSINKDGKFEEIEPQSITIIEQFSLTPASENDKEQEATVQIDSDIRGSAVVLGDVKNEADVQKISEAIDATDNTIRETFANSEQLDNLDAIDNGYDDADERNYEEEKKADEEHDL